MRAAVANWLWYCYCKPQRLWKFEPIRSTLKILIDNHKSRTYFKTIEASQFSFAACPSVLVLIFEPLKIDHSLRALYVRHFQMLRMNVIPMSYLRSISHHKDDTVTILNLSTVLGSLFCVWLAVSGTRKVNLGTGKTSRRCFYIYEK